MKILLALDISTVSTGYAVFNADTKGLIEYGAIHPINPKGYTKLKYPKAQLIRLISMAEQIVQLIQRVNPDHLVIEEVNRGINRIAQKSLDSTHFMMLYFLMKAGSPLLDTLEYVDSNGKKGWRGKLGLKLSDQDKEWNALARKFNKTKASKGNKKIVVNWKHLAARKVQELYGLSFDVNVEESNADIVDAICLGASRL